MVFKLQQEWQDIHNYFVKSKAEFHKQAANFCSTDHDYEIDLFRDFMQQIEIVRYSYISIVHDLKNSRSFHLQRFRIALLKAIEANKKITSPSTQSLFLPYRELLDDLLIEIYRIIIFRVDNLLKNIALIRVKSKLSTTNSLFYLNPKV